MAWWLELHSDDSWPEALYGWRFRVWDIRGLNRWDNEGRWGNPKIRIRI